MGNENCPLKLIKTFETTISPPLTFHSGAYLINFYFKEAKGRKLSTLPFGMEGGDNESESWQNLQETFPFRKPQC